MASKPSAKSCYQSHFGGGYVTVAQFLAEGMCARMARKQGKDLPDRFWNLPAWKRIWLNQQRLADALLKLYDARAIIAALKRVKWVCSLGNTMTLDPLLREEQDRLDRQKQAVAGQPTSQPTPQIIDQPLTRTPYPAKAPSLLSKLDDA